MFVEVLKGLVQNPCLTMIRIFEKKIDGCTLGVNAPNGLQNKGCKETR